MRAHKPRFVMAMYYPAEVTEDMGPTSVIPRTQYWTVDRRGFNQNEERLDPAMTPPLDADGWRAANAETGNTSSVLLLLSSVAERPHSENKSLGYNLHF